MEISIMSPELPEGVMTRSGGSSDIKMAEDTRVEALLKRLKNRKWLSLVVVGGVIFLALVSFAKGLQETGDILGKAFSRSALISQYDASTKDALIMAAHNVDLFLLNIESSPEPVAFPAVRGDFIRIKAELRSILLRNRVRALNDLSAKHSELLLKQWNNVEKLLQQPDGVNPATVHIAGDAMFRTFNAMLTLEETKQQVTK